MFTTSVCILARINVSNLILIGLPYSNTVAISMERPRVANEIGDLSSIVYTETSEDHFLWV